MLGLMHERSIPIQIKKTSSSEKVNELSLNTSFFDPSKMSPPNNFIEKLQLRMDNYYSPTEKKSFNFKTVKPIK